MIFAVLLLVIEFEFFTFWWYALFELGMTFHGRFFPHIRSRLIPPNRSTWILKRSCFCSLLHYHWTDIALRTQSYQMLLPNAFHCQLHSQLKIHASLQVSCIWFQNKMKCKDQIQSQIKYCGVDQVQKSDFRKRKIKLIEACCKVVSPINRKETAPVKHWQTK